eukprot:TRINITY_DN129_c0_g2_i1.p1 TRINITY_DN129_c0_g2~~TRINITY_DN129_c0_g2_i1.p1  ORF type:complete len:208 (+),score=49.16 TRINITY_DN129_c0_g2_i1:51-626(+)
MPIENSPERDGNNPIMNDKEEIKLTEPRTKLHIGALPKGEGFLHLTNQRIVWLAESGLGCAIDYPFISVHAVSRDTSSWPEPCLYCQLRTEEPVGPEEDEEEIEIPELRFVPSDPAQLNRIFSVFSEMSALNPDPRDDQEDASSSGGGSDDLGMDMDMDLGMAQQQQLGVIWNAEDNDAAMEDADSSDDQI